MLPSLNKIVLRVFSVLLILSSLLITVVVANDTLTKQIITSYAKGGCDDIGSPKGRQACRKDKEAKDPNSKTFAEQQAYRDAHPDIYKTGTVYEQQLDGSFKTFKVTYKNGSTTPQNKVDITSSVTWGESDDPDAPLTLTGIVPIAVNGTPIDYKPPTVIPLTQREIDEVNKEQKEKNQALIDFAKTNKIQTTDDLLDSYNMTAVEYIPSLQEVQQYQQMIQQAIKDYGLPTSIDGPDLNGLVGTIDNGYIMSGPAITTDYSKPKSYWESLFSTSNQPILPENFNPQMSGMSIAGGQSTQLPIESCNGDSDCINNIITGTKLGNNVGIIATTIEFGTILPVWAIAGGKIANLPVALSIYSSGSLAGVSPIISAGTATYITAGAIDCAISGSGSGFCQNAGNMAFQGYSLDPAGFTQMFNQAARVYSDTYAVASSIRRIPAIPAVEPLAIQSPNTLNLSFTDDVATNLNPVSKLPHSTITPPALVTDMESLLITPTNVSPLTTIATAINPNSPQLIGNINIPLVDVIPVIPPLDGNSPPIGANGTLTTMLKDTFNLDLSVLQTSLNKIDWLKPFTNLFTKPTTPQSTADIATKVSNAIADDYEHQPIAKIILPEKDVPFVDIEPSTSDPFNIKQPEPIIEPPAPLAEAPVEVELPQSLSNSTSSNLNDNIVQPIVSFFNPIAQPIIQATQISFSPNYAQNPIVSIAKNWINQHNFQNPIAKNPENLLGFLRSPVANIDPLILSPIPSETVFVGGNEQVIARDNFAINEMSLPGRTYNLDALKKSSDDINIDSISLRKLFDLGNSKNIIAHGVESDKAGRSGLFAIMIDGIKGRYGMSPFAGTLTDGDSARTAGPHGPYFIVLNRNYMDTTSTISPLFHEAYLVPNIEEKNILLKAVNEALNKKILTIDHAKILISKIFTYDEYITINEPSFYEKYNIATIFQNVSNYFDDIYQKTGGKAAQRLAIYTTSDPKGNLIIIADPVRGFSLAENSVNASGEVYITQTNFFGEDNINLQTLNMESVTPISLNDEVLGKYAKVPIKQGDIIKIGSTIYNFLNINRDLPFDRIEIHSNIPALKKDFLNVVYDKLSQYFLKATATRPPPSAPQPPANPPADGGGAGAGTGGELAQQGQAPVLADYGLTKNDLKPITDNDFADSGTENIQIINGLLNTDIKIYVVEKPIIPQDWWYQLSQKLFGNSGELEMFVIREEPSIVISRQALSDPSDVISFELLHESGHLYMKEGMIYEGIYVNYAASEVVAHLYAKAYLINKYGITPESNPQLFERISNYLQRDYFFYRYVLSVDNILARIQNPALIIQDIKSFIFAPQPPANGDGTGTGSELAGSKPASIQSVPTTLANYRLSVVRSANNTVNLVKTEMAKTNPDFLKNIGQDLNKLTTPPAWFDKYVPNLVPDSWIANFVPTKSQMLFAPNYNYQFETDGGIIISSGSRFMNTPFSVYVAPVVDKAADIIAHVAEKLTWGLARPTVTKRVLLTISILNTIGQSLNPMPLHIPLPPQVTQSANTLILSAEDAIIEQYKIQNPFNNPLDFNLQAPESVEPIAPYVRPILNVDNLQISVNTLIESAGGNNGLYIKEVRGTTAILHNPNLVIHGASTMNIPIAIASVRVSELSGGNDMQIIKHQIELLLVDDDPDARKNLINYVNNYEKSKGHPRGYVLSQLGASNTDILYMTTTVESMAKLLEGLITNSLNIKESNFIVKVINNIPDSKSIPWSYNQEGTFDNNFHGSVGAIVNTPQTVNRQTIKFVAGNAGYLTINDQMFVVVIEGNATTGEQFESIKTLLKDLAKEITSVTSNVTSPAVLTPIVPAVIKPQTNLDQSNSFPYFSQKDSQWQDMPTWGGATIYNAGCGIMTGAMVTNSNPRTYYDNFQAYFKSIGKERRVSKAGTGWEDHRVVLEYMGYEVIPVEGSPIDIKNQIKNYTDQGIPVWVNARVYGIGHNLVAIGIDPTTGYILFNDPWRGPSVAIPDNKIKMKTDKNGLGWRVFAIIPPSQ